MKARRPTALCWTRAVAGAVRLLAATSTACLAALTLPATGCASSPAEPPASPTRPASRTAKPAANPSLAGPPAMPARVLAELPHAGVEIRLARRGDDGLLLVQQDGRWWTSRISYRTAAAPPAAAPSAAAAPQAPRAAGSASSSPSQAPPPQGELVDAGTAPSEPAIAALAAIKDGYLLAWLVPTDGSTELTALRLDPSGRPRGAPAVIARSVDEVRWIELFPTDRGALVLWELGAADGRELRVEAWPTAKPSSGRPVAARCLGWHAVATTQGAAVAAVIDEQPGASSHLGRAALWRIEADATVREPIELSPPSTAVPDVQAAFAKDRIVVAWTDVRRVAGVPHDGAGDPRVYVAAVGLDGRLLVQPRPLPSGLGEQALVALTADATSGRAAIAWEPQVPNTTNVRRVRLQWLDQDAQSPDGTAVLEFWAGADAPQLAASATGLGVLTLARPQAQADAANGSAVPPRSIVPTFVWLDPRLEVTASEPVRIAELGEPGVPDLVRSLHCTPARCDAIATGGDEPALVTVVDLARRASPWLAVAQRTAEPAGPKGDTLGTVARTGAGPVDMTATRLADGRELVAWLEQPPDDDPQGPTQSATLSYRFVSPQGELGPVVVLSDKAVSMGGIDLVPLEPPNGKAVRGGAVAVLTWVAPNNNAPQVFATAIGATGQKVGQKAITLLRATKPAIEIADVSIASDGKGELLLAWSDTRDGNPEIYAARIDARLTRKGPERRLTDAPGASTEPRFAVAGDRAYLVWSDAREAATLGVADIYVAVVDPKTLDKRGSEQRLFHSPTHSRGPSITLAAEGPVVWWLEDAVPDGADAADGLRVMRLGSSAEPLASPNWLRPAGAAAVRSASVGCDGAECRVAMGWLEDTAFVVGATTLPTVTAVASSAANAKPAVTRLGTWAAPTIHGVPLSCTDSTLSTLYFVTNSGSGTAVVRRLGLQWP